MFYHGEQEGDDTLYLLSSDQPARSDLSLLPDVTSTLITICQQVIGLT